MVKCLPLKHEDLSSIPSTHVEARHDMNLPLHMLVYPPRCVHTWKINIKIKRNLLKEAKEIG